MNERIRELIKQADEKFTCEYNGTYTVFNKEKFAELIVNECANIAAKNQAENMNWNIAEIIKEHFGVEE